MSRIILSNRNRIEVFRKENDVVKFHFLGLGGLVAVDFDGEAKKKQMFMFVRVRVNLHVCYITVLPVKDPCRPAANSTDFLDQINSCRIKLLITRTRHEKRTVSSRRMEGGG